MKKILIADPDEVLGSVYREELEEEGYSVSNCSDPAKLMSAIATEQPGLILIDTQMVLYAGEGFNREIENHLPVAPPILYTSGLRPKPKKWVIPSENFVRKTRNLKLLKNKINSILSAEPKVKSRKPRLPTTQMSFLWKSGKH
jgi:DNA-binding response OmpR family regulator